MEIYLALSPVPRVLASCAAPTFERWLTRCFILLRRVAFGGRCRRILHPGLFLRMASNWIIGSDQPLSCHGGARTGRQTTLAVCWRSTGHQNHGARSTEHGARKCGSGSGSAEVRAMMLVRNKCAQASNPGRRARTNGCAGGSQRRYSGLRRRNCRP
jgi:hypothetical protein